MRQVEHIMGLPITIDIPGCQEPGVFKGVFERLRGIDRRFSPYSPDSEVSRYAGGKLQNAELSQELKKVIKACQEWSARTDGYFSAWADGKFDPSGYVKGWAIAETGKVIEKHGYKTYCIGAGGDILARSAEEKTWNIGIQDPSDKSKILNKLSISNGGVATSGNYERGLHIFNPKTKQPVDKLLSVTVAGPDIITADVLATAVFAAGLAAPAFAKNFPDYQALVV